MGELKNMGQRIVARAFSLTEVVIALGIATVSVVAVLGLFPVGLDTARESDVETEAAVLARTIAADFTASIRNRAFTNAILIRGKATDRESNWIIVNFNNAGTYVIGLKKEVQGGDGGMIGSPYCLRPSADLSNAIPANGVANLDFIAAVTVRPLFGGGELAQVGLTIEHPASVPQTNRTRHLYSWYVSQQTNF